MRPTHETGMLLAWQSFSELPLRGGAWGFPPANMNMASSYFDSKENRGNIEPKETPSCFISHLLDCCIFQASS